MNTARWITKHIREFIKVRLEQSPNNAQIARDVKNKFNLDTEIEAIRHCISRTRRKLKIEAKRVPIKRLFFDIETSYYVLNIKAWQLKNFQRYFNPDDIVREKEIICISYKWQYEDKVHSLDWRKGEKQMLKEFVKVIGEADEIIGHNGDKFDIKFLRTRCLYHGVLMFPNYRTLDTLKKARGSFLFASNKLDYLGKFTRIGGKQEHDGMELWEDVVEKKSKKRLKEMVRYCERDVAMLEDLYFVMSPFITHNNNFAVLTGGNKWDCPDCGDKNVEMHHTYTTAMGIIRRQMKCNKCKKQYKISNKNYMGMLEHIHKEGS